MRVVFAGQTGIEKKIVLHNLVCSLLQREGLPESLDDPRTRRFLWVRDLEAAIEQQTGYDTVTDFLETANQGYAAEQWGLAFRQLLGDLEEQDPEHAFLSMHLTFRVPGRSPLPYRLDDISRFRPTHVITLIDDIFEVQSRIHEWNISHATDFDFSLRELVWWRAQEMGMAAWISRNLPSAPVVRGGSPEAVKNYIVAVKHPVNMLRGLLFEPQKRRVYASIPITSTRDDASRRQEIDGVRAKLHNSLTVFDPLTIDELSPWVFSKASNGNSVTLEKDDPFCRWPIAEADTLGAGRNDVYPIVLSGREVLEIREDVEHSIRLRDFGLIDNCEYVVGYRPNYEGNFSRGMFAEFNHAFNVCKPPVRIHYYFPSSDGTNMGPFAAFRMRHGSLDEWWRVVENL